MTAPRRRKIAYAAIVLSLFALAAHTRFSLPLDPLVDPDLLGYLGPALLKLDGHPFVHLNGLNSLYPGALYFILRVLPDLRAITVIQHTLGLAAGAFFLLGWNRLVDFFQWRSGMTAAGVAGLAAYLLANTPVLMELQIRSDAVCMFVQMVGFWLCAEFFYCRWISNDPRRATMIAIAVVADASVLASLKPSFTLAAIGAVVPVAWLILRWNGHRYQRAAVLALSAGVIAVVVIPEHLLARADPVSQTFAAETLFSIHADIIARQMALDADGSSDGRFPRAWLRSAAADLQEALESSKAGNTTFASLGFNADALRLGTPLFERWRSQLGSGAFDEFLRIYFWRSVMGQPGNYLAKVGRQIRIFYALKCPAFPVKEKLPLAGHYALALKALRAPYFQRVTAPFAWMEAYEKRIVALQPTLPRIHQAEIPKRLNQFLAYAYLPVFVASMVGVTWVAFQRRSTLQEKRQAFLTLFFYLPNLGNTVGIAAVHSMQIDRYSTVQFAAALFAELFAIFWLASLVRAMARPRHMSEITAAPRAPLLRVTGDVTNGERERLC